MKIILISILLFSSTLFGNIGKITALSGDVSISRASQNISATIGFELEEKDKIATKSNARVQLVFQDKTVISLGKNSTFDIEEYFYDTQKPSETKASFKVARGIFKTITGQIGKINPNQFTLKTKSASIGIRGTIFFGDVPPPETPNQPEVFTCTDGIIVVSTPQGVQQVGANQFTSVTPGQAPTPPQDVPPAQMNDAEQDSGASQNEQESGQDANLFFEQTFGDDTVTPPEPSDGIVVDDSKDLAEETTSSVVSSNKTDELANNSKTSLHYLTLSSSFTISTSDAGFSFSYITNDTITTKLGTGSIMSISTNSNDFDWGFWSSSGETAGDYVAEKVWITGKNLVSDISSLSGSASYSGKILGITSGGTLISPTNSTITLNFNFGTSKVDVTFDQVNGSTGFNGITQGTYTTSGSVYTIQDSQSPDNTLQGSFYDNLNTTAGTFKVNNNQGVYNATKQ